MPALTHPLPEVSVADAEEILLTHWKLRGQVRVLPGERERNFHVYTGEGREFVLKVASPLESLAVIELQVEALSHIATTRADLPVPRIVPATDGSRLVSHPVKGEDHSARLLTWLPGRPLAEVSPHAPDLLREIGRSLGALTAALATFRHPAARRDLKWDLGAAGWIAGHVARLEEDGPRHRVERILDEYTSRLAPELARTRASVVHNDANDYNVLVTGTSDGRLALSGIIDYGDLLYSHPVCDLAIAIAYVMMGKPDPLSAATPLVAGYHESFPMSERELGLLFPLARTRLAVSVVNAALQAKAEPGNAYLQVSADGAARLLEQLDTVHPRLAEYRFRDACGLEPCPGSAAVARWLDANREHVAPLSGSPFGPGDVHVHDFSVTSGTIGSIEQWSDQRRFTQLVNEELASVGARVGIGRYDEVRALYTTDLFRVEGNDGPEWRTVHLGIDVGAAPGAAIHAPIDGIVHSLRDNDAAGDYGPTVILEHAATHERPVFWTLYGHLNRETLTRVQPGQSIRAGDAIGWLGDVSVNGGWWPHVHVQVICDLFDRSGDFQGVARPVERTVMLSVSPDPSPLLGLDASGRASRAADVSELRQRRTRHIGPSLSVSYRRPLHIVRGAYQYLIDGDGRRYLDAVNNVAHVGHAHPDVVRAGQRQMAVLNTNTRYLHPAILDYAERLTATLPDPLCVCYLVNSGSEANELAVRMARAWSGERDMIVVESGYHGNTSTLVDISPYKFNGPGGSGAPDWVQVVPMPDTYRGPFRDDDATAGIKYAQAVRQAVRRIRQAGRRPAAFLCESILSCGGQVPLPEGYLAEAYRHVRAAGGLCIADEVQVGLGRVGAHWWAFQAHGVIPDIVTMGKPLGNGHPLGAVVTTPDVAARFTNGMEYFNTFGGNPVSCVIGLEVLDVIEREHLRQRALETGEYLKARLGEVMSRHQLIGDVRGEGLFIGIELVADREERRPAGAAASHVANRMRELAVLLSTDGPDNNVLKIKPPLCFSRADADTLSEALDRVLGETLPGLGA